MPRTIAVDVVADTSALTRGFTKATRESEKFARRTEHQFARVRSSIAFTSTALIGGTGLVYAFEKVIGAATDAAIAQRSLTAQMKATGESFRRNQTVIEKAELSMSRFGFTGEESAAALTVLDRATGDIRKALYLQAGVADLARAKNIGLADAAAAVGKVFGGQETALRRAVPGLDKNRHGIDLIRQAFQKLAGQARAATTPQERFYATLHETEILIGQALLPQFNLLLTSFSKWLDRVNRSQKTQQELAATAHAIAVGFSDAAVAIGAAADAYQKYSGIVSHLPGFLKVIFQPGYGIQKIFNALKGRGGGAKAPPGLGGPIGVGTRYRPPGMTGPLGKAPINWATTPAIKIPKRVSGTAAGLPTSWDFPMSLQLALSRAEALGQPTRRILMAMRAAAFKALHSGLLAVSAQKDAWDAIAQLNDQLKKGAKKAHQNLRRQGVLMGRAYGAEYQFAYAAPGPRIHVEHLYVAASSPRQLEDQLARRARARAHPRHGAK